MLVVSNGHVTLSDKRKRLVTEDAFRKVYWDCERHINIPSRHWIKNNKQFEDLGCPLLFYANDIEGIGSSIFLSLWTRFEDSPKEIAEKMLAFGTMRNFAFEALIVFDSGHVLTLTLSKSDGLEIIRKPPGELSLIGDGSWPGQNFCLPGTQIDNKTLHDFYMASAASEGEVSINFDRATLKDGKIQKEFDIRPTVEEEKQAVADFFHPRYQLKPVKRYFSKARF